MRRAKVKATICIGRKKPDSSRKINENHEDSSTQNATSDINELKSIHESPTKDIKHPIKITTPTEPIPQESPKPPVIPSAEVCPVENPISSTSSSDCAQPADSVLTIPPSDPKYPPNSILPKDSEFLEPSKENSVPLINRGIINRSKIKAVPKLRGRKTCSSSAPLENEEKKTDLRITTIEQTSDTPCVQESTSNSPVESSFPDNANLQLTPIPPTSPSKVCRSKIKAVPILGNRKHFSSASDSEDGNKKNNSTRTRTESQCSNISGIQETTVEQHPTLKKSECSSEIKRKCRKSDGSKKLAEARREFAKKYVDGKPDHKRLTMMDLIFYNPTSNPMRYENKKSKVTTEIHNTHEDAEEDVDNPVEIGSDDSPNKDDEHTDKMDDEDEILAPRIKIGPTGEIVLDEKSLVVESKKTKKAMEEIEKSEAIDGDSDRPYGVYKKCKRSKEWSQSETVKFYRALSTVGTDFSLMNDLFPKRTRKELKMKFKKEEKINQALVDQAIMKPCNFNFEELKTEFEMMEIEALEIEQQQINRRDSAKKKQNKKSAKFLKIIQENNSPDNTDDSRVVESGNENKPVKKRQRKPKTPKLPKPPKKLDILSALNSESDSSDEESVNSEESAVWNPIHTTRYGRKTRRREFYEPNVDPDEELAIQKKIRKPNSEPEPTQKPGSLMVVSSETPDGQPMVQIFMVTDDETKNGDQNELNPKNLLPIAMIRTGHTDDEAEEEIIENNYTIPAEEQNNTEETHKKLTNNEEKVEEVTSVSIEIPKDQMS